MLIFIRMITLVVKYLSCAAARYIRAIISGLDLVHNKPHVFLLKVKKKITHGNVTDTAIAYHDAFYSRV